MGRYNNLGSQMASPEGKSYGGWIKTYDYTVTPVALTWFGVTNMGNSYNMWMINTGWTVDYQPMSGCVLVDVQGNAGTGWAFWANITGSTANFNDGQYHHHMIAFSGFSSGKPITLQYFIDGKPFDLRAANDISDPGGIGGSCVNFASASYMGCDGKTDAMTPIDMSTFDMEDFRVYTRCLDPREVQQIVKLRGRDNIKRGLVMRIPFWTDGRNLGSYRYSVTPQNNGGGSSNPTITKSKFLSGIRKKVT